jgi:hypothetical protein
MNKLLCLAIIIISIGEVASETSKSIWDEALINIPRLSANSFPMLPKEVSDFLNASEYKIPQCTVIPEEHNVISGNFDSDSTLDYAILVSQNYKCKILIFWGSSADSVKVLEERSEMDFLQSDVEGIIFSRVIKPADKSQLKTKNVNFTSSFSHQGIEDIFLGKASKIFYYQNDVFLNLRGAD